MHGGSGDGGGMSRPEWERETAAKGIILIDGVLLRFFFVFYF